MRQLLAETQSESKKRTPSCDGLFSSPSLLYQRKADGLSKPLAPRCAITPSGRSIGTPGRSTRGGASVPGTPGSVRRAGSGTPGGFRDDASVCVSSMDDMEEDNAKLEKLVDGKTLDTFVDKYTSEDNKCAPPLPPPAFSPPSVYLFSCHPLLVQLAAGAMFLNFRSSSPRPRRSASELMLKDAVNLEKRRSWIHEQSAEYNLRQKKLLENGPRQEDGTLNMILSASYDEKDSLMHFVPKTEYDRQLSEAESRRPPK